MSVRRIRTVCRIGIAAAALVHGLLAAGTARAGYENAGTTAANFLSLGIGARTLAMAGAGLGLGEDAVGAAWNPAALGWVAGTEAALSHAALPDRSLQEWGALGGRLARTPLRWGVSGLYQGAGPIEGMDVNGVSTGNLSVSSVAFGATLAQPIGGRMTLGVTAKAVREDIAGVSGSGVTFDTGLLVRAGPLGFGIAAQNLGGAMAFGAARYPFPTSFGVGLGFTHPGTGLRLAVDANLPSAYHADLRAGAEWLVHGVFAVRAGYRHELGSPGDPLSGPTFGLGASHGGMWLDYGYVLTGDDGGQHRMGFRFHLGGPLAGEATGRPEKPAGPGEFDWARDGSRLGPTPTPKR